MKKLAAILLVLGLAVSVVGFSADAAVKKPAAKKVMKKVVKKAVKKAAPKAAPMRAPAAPAPVPPVAPVPPPPPAPVSVRPVAPSQGIFGWGINSNLSGIYANNGKGLLGTLAGRGDIVIDDPLALASFVGLSANSLKYKVGVGAVYGKGSADKNIRAIPVYVDALLNLPADLMMGVETYVSGGANYVLYGSGAKTGKSGLQVEAGIKVDLGLGLGKTDIALGYSIVRANTESAKGITLSVGMPIVL